MKNYYILFLFLISYCAHAEIRNPRFKRNTNLPRQQNLPFLVNPFIGTGGHGHTFPGPTMPFGACQLSPDTRLTGWDGCSGYHYSDSIIYGFSHTHLSGTGCSDYGDILVMPITKEMPINNYQFASSFSHKGEKAHAGYYSVHLNASNIDVALTTTLHGGVHEYTYPKGSSMYVVVDLKHRDELLESHLKKKDDYTISGYRFSKAWAANQKVFFEMKFSNKIKRILYEAGNAPSETSAIQLEKSKQCLIEFESGSGNIPSELPTLLLKCAISGVDEEGAHKNLLAEMGDDDFQLYVTNCMNDWATELRKVNPSGTLSKNEQIIFYTALYHCMIHPSLYSDVDGRYRGRDDKIHSTEGKFDYYTVFSLWDTYRALHPLLTLIDKKRTADFIQTFVRQYEDGGRLPVWELSSNETNCMIGYHVVSVIWDAYNKGINNFDVEKAYEAMTKIATHFTDYTGTGLDLTLRDDAKKRCADAEALESYCRYGYIRSDDSHESVSKTLEYAYNDWCIAQMARSLNKEADAKYYENRSYNWMNVFDPGSGFMRARKNSCLYKPFSPYTVDNNYTEANSWQYSFYVPHHIENLIELKGGKTKMKEALDKLFSAKTKTEGREQADITGLIGQYAHGNEPSHHIAYIYSYLGLSDKTESIVNKIMKEFYTNKPDGLIGNEDCGQMSAWYVLNKMGRYSFCPGQEDFIELKKNVALSKNLGSMNKVSSPYITKGERIFDGTQYVTITSMQIKNKIHYSLNKGGYKGYTTPIKITENAEIQFYSEQENGNQSPIQTAVFSKLPKDRKIVLKNKYNPSYHAGGANGLVDGIYGKLNWRAGDWQGYQGEDVEIIMQFNQGKQLDYVAANFLEDQNSWIFHPKEVAFYSSLDGTKWDLIESISTQKSDHNLITTISKFSSTKLNGKQEIKFVKVIAKNFGPMPQWHEGRGNPTFIFIDEFEVK